MFPRAIIFTNVLVLVAGIVGWIHSYTREKSWLMKHPVPISFSLGDRSILINSWNGSFDLAAIHTIVADDQAQKARSSTDLGPIEWKKQVTYRKSLLGLYETIYVSLKISYWLPLLFLSIYPIAELIYIPIRRHNRRAAGQCIYCGYDLRGAVDERCSECGAKILD
jgi:hypothetical protein